MPGAGRGMDGDPAAVSRGFEGKAAGGKVKTP